jgi:hypothetical protein
MYFLNKGVEVAHAYLLSLPQAPSVWYGEPTAISNAVGYAKFLQPLT